MKNYFEFKDGKTTTIIPFDKICAIDFKDGLANVFTFNSEYTWTIRDFTAGLLYDYRKWLETRKD